MKRIVCALISIFMFLSGCAPTPTPTPTATPRPTRPRPTPRPQTYTIAYRVTCPMYPSGMTPKLGSYGGEHINASVT